MFVPSRCSCPAGEAVLGSASVADVGTKLKRGRGRAPPPPSQRPGRTSLPSGACEHGGLSPEGDERVAGLRLHVLADHRRTR